MDDLQWLDATAQAHLVRRGEVTPAELVDAALRRIETLDPDLNAVIIDLAGKAAAAAEDPALPDGPFRGVPMLVKDLHCATAGDPLYSGSRFLQRLGHTAERDGHLAARYRAGGLVVCGRTNVPEMGATLTTEPAAFGATRNPWDRTRSPGGSSGGSAAAVAAGLVPIAHASDAAGSIRNPASHCGLVGLKPSRGRNSALLAEGDQRGLVMSEHVLTRSVRDAAALLDATLAGEVGADPGRLRIGLLRRVPGDLAPLHADCLAALDRAVKLLTDLGHDVDESHPAAIEERRLGLALSKVYMAQFAADLDRWERLAGEPAGPDDLEPMTRAFVEIGRTVSGVDVLTAGEQLSATARAVAEWFDAGFDLLLLVSAHEPPPPLGALVSPPDDPLEGGRRTLPSMALCSFANGTGLPAISLPLHWTADGLPVGAQLVAPYAREDTLVRVAAQLEQAAPWADRHPPPS
jgi:amidase